MTGACGIFDLEIPQNVTVYDAIRADDENSLQKFSSEPGFDPNARAVPSIFESSTFIVNSLEPAMPTLLQMAAYHQAVNCYKFLLLNGADMDMNDLQGRSLAHYALAGGNIEIIRNVQQYKEIDQKLIAIPVKFHDFNIFEWLFLPHFNTIDGMSEEEKMRVFGVREMLLRSAASANNLEVLKYILEKNVNVNAVDAIGWTALHYACDNGHYETVSILLQVTGIDVNVQDAKG